MISNLYTWIFPAALFIAAGLSNLSSGLKPKTNRKKIHSNRIVWFSLNLSIAFCFIAASVFFVDWSEFVWLSSYLYFLLIIITVFYFIFMFKFIIGLPIIIFLTFIILIFNIYLQDWKTVPDSGIIGWYRLLSYDETEIKAEISSFDSSSIFITEVNSDFFLEIELLELDRSLFFINSHSYYRIAESLKVPGILDKIIDFLSDNTIFVSENSYSLEITQFDILHKYNIILDKDQKLIFTDY